MSSKFILFGVIPIALFKSVAIAQENQNYENIVIKGTRQHQSLLDTPASVSVIDKETILQSGISQLRDIDELLPNVSISQIGQIGGSYISIRGIESNPFVVNRAAVYIDGIPYREPDNINIRQAQQIEVLKGPQSALYGANADAGIIVINTATPSSDLQVSLFSDVEHFSNGQAYKGGVTVSGEVFSDFFSSLEVEVQNGDSYVKNEGATNNEKGHIDNLRIYSRSRIFLPSDNGEININIMVTDNQSPGLYEQEFAPLDTTTYNDTFSALYNNNQLAGEYILLHDAPKNTDEDEWSAGASYKGDFGNYTLNGTIAYREANELGFGNDLDLTLAPFAAGGNKVERDFLNAEFQISEELTNGATWFSGAAYYEQHRTQNLFTLAGGGSISDYQEAPAQSSSLKNMAVFGYTRYPLTNSLSLHAGLRFENSNAQVSQQAGSLTLGSLVLNYVELDAEQNSDVWLPQVALSWQPDGNQNVFISASRGYLPGGYNLVAADKGDEIASQYGPYENETLWSYEIGYKNNISSLNLFVTGALFYVDASSWQEVSLLTAPDGTVLSTVLISSNAAITSQGAEAELMWQPDTHFSLRAGAGYTHSEYDSNNYSDSVSYAGNKVKMIPEWDTSLTAKYEWDAGWYLRAQWRFLGRTALTTDNAIFRPGTSLFDAALGYQTREWKVRLFVENLTDRRYAAGQAYQNFIMGFDETYYAPLSSPRVAGIEVQWQL